MEYFGFPAKDGKILEANKKKRDVVRCGKRVKYNGNTTNLRVHIRDTHSKVYRDLLQSEKEKTAASKARAERQQPTLAQVYERSEVFPRQSPRWNQLTDALCYFIARDMQPFDTVNDSGFQHLLHALEPRYVPPDKVCKVLVHCW